MTNAAPALLRLTDVLACVPVSKTTLYRWSRSGLFPRPRSLTPTGNTVAWLASEVYAWIEAKQAANDGTFDGI
ncbi:AlpA family phage regulatory protein [Dyella sp.]|jgi:prophage regulatory protein|uniref:helix-turn-helix transcriptional regulator n=1 Tax=Dyella sp. TaxID=1869338 RepID=UPI00284D2538|nr:AlpA family phage regulatory protein [Dyella sp.]MDR3446025.1 AlpA family phage regulatory protein [Dyella sp.]